MGLGEFLKYMKRDERWLSFNVACGALACICFTISSLMYMIIGVPAHTFCLVMLFVGASFMVPCILMWNKLRKAEKQRKKKLSEGGTPTPIQ